MIWLTLFLFKQPMGKEQLETTKGGKGEKEINNTLLWAEWGKVIGVAVKFGKEKGKNGVVVSQVNGWLLRFVQTFSQTLKF